jgi:hypothetical protein
MNAIINEGGFLVINGRELDLRELEFLVNNSNNLSAYSDAINDIVYSFMRIVSGVAVSAIDDTEKGKILADMTYPERFCLLQLLSDQLKKIEL